MSQRRNPFTRGGSPSTGPSGSGSGSVSRPKSAVFSTPSPLSSTTPPPSHGRNRSVVALAANLAPPNNAPPRHQRSDSKSSQPTSSTFAPSFIKAEDLRSTDVVKGIEGENDFSGRRYVWLKDPQAAFVKGWVVEDLAGGRILVQCDDGSVRNHHFRVIY